MSEQSQVSYCGLFCGTCPIRQSKVDELSEELLNKLETPELQKIIRGLPKVFPEQFSSFKDIDKFYEILKEMKNLGCSRICKEEGGTTNCKIRICCRDKDIEGCWECSQFENCETLSWIDPNHKLANILNLQIIRDKGMDAFLSLKEKNW
ncbi:MAG: DUF3795 domain-containing protein [Sedimentisphaerales bacterium]|nr:DUF3795 domain-containing protein [Sedimentisphaerales bacterium]